MGYMEQFKYVEDMIYLTGDFPKVAGPIQREGDTLRFVSDFVDVTCNFEHHSSGVIKRCDSVKNVSDRPITLHTAQSRFTFLGGEHEVYTQYNEHNLEGQSGWAPLITEVGVRGTESRTSCNSAPFAALWNLQTNRGMAFHVFDYCLWSIRFRKHYVQPLLRKSVILDIGLENGHFSYTLQPGQTLELPAILFYPVRNKVDLDAYKLHRYCNEKFMPKPMPATYNTWMSKFDFISYDILMEQLEKAAELGLEYFVIDAGWFGEPFKWYANVGDWAECTEAGIAGRMKEFADQVRAKGLKFGLWFEAERASLQSKAYAAHPEYYHLEFDRAMLDFANPDAVDFLFNVVKENIDKYGIEYIKFDHNAILSHDPKQDCFLQHFQGYDNFIRRLREAYPDLYLEGCASGGMRIAACTLKHFDSYWLTDNQNIHEQMDIFTNAVIRMPNRALELWATVQTLPDFEPHPKGQALNKLITGDGNWRIVETTTIPYLVNAMYGGPISISCDLTKLSQDVLDAMAKTVEQFKQERQFWNNSECHILSYTPSIMVLQYCTPEMDELKVFAYTSRNEQNGVTVYPVCDPNATYVLPDGTEMNGALLNEQGVDLPVGKTKFASNSICFKKKA